MPRVRQGAPRHQRVQQEGAWLWGQSHSARLGRARPQGFVLQPCHQVYPEQLSGSLRPQRPGRAWHPRPPFLPTGEINPMPQCEQSKHPSLCPHLHWSDVKPLCLVTTSHGSPQRTQKGVHQSLVFPQARSSSGHPHTGVFTQVCTHTQVRSPYRFCSSQHIPEDIPHWQAGALVLCGHEAHCGRGTFFKNVYLFGCVGIFLFSRSTWDLSLWCAGS